jgi:glycosyltransferase involved in cell wall biosynthesis
MLDQITPLIITFNEELNIKRVLNKMKWARKIVVIDSGSTDSTLDVLGADPRIDVSFHPFEDFASQCNFGLTKIGSPWVLSLDADYELSDALIAEMRNLAPHENTSGYSARFVYRIFGRSLHGTLYPPRTVLYRKDKAHYRKDGHGHRVMIQGNVAALKSVVYHDDRKPLVRWALSQQRYAREEATSLLQSTRSELSRVDKIRRMGWPAPILVSVYVLFVNGCILDGWPGWYYALQRLLAETLTALEIVDRRLRDEKQS